MSKQPQLADFKQIAKDHHLKLIIEEPLREPLLAIVNLKVRSLSVVSREIFSQEQGIIWAEDVINIPAPTSQEEKIALQQAQSCWKALLQTDYGFGVTNLQAIQQGYIALYEGYFVDKENRPEISQRQSREFQETLFNKTYVASFTPTGASSASGLISAQTHRGFGGFMQHLPNEKEITAYRLHAEFKNHAVCENLSRVNLGKRVFLKAKQPIPALSPIVSPIPAGHRGKPRPVARPRPAHPEPHRRARRTIAAASKDAGFCAVVDAGTARSYRKPTPSRPSLK